MHEGDFAVLKELCGSYKRLAQQLGISERHLRRYRRGEWPVPEKVQLAAEGLICRMLHQNRPMHTEAEDKLRRWRAKRRMWTKT